MPTKTKPKLKISSTARTQGWLTTEYNNQNNPAVGRPTSDDKIKTKSGVNLSFWWGRDKIDQ